jgi:hypothetical protein
MSTVFMLLSVAKASWTRYDAESTFHWRSALARTGEHTTDLAFSEAQTA